MDSIKGFPGGASGKEPTCQCRGPRFDPLGWEEPLEKEMEPTPVFLPGESRGQRSLAGYSPRGHKSQTRLKRHSLDAQALHLVLQGFLQSS